MTAVLLVTGLVGAPRSPSSAALERLPLTPGAADEFDAPSPCRVRGRRRGARARARGASTVRPATVVRRWLRAPFRHELVTLEPWRAAFVGRAPPLRD